MTSNPEGEAILPDPETISEGNFFGSSYACQRRWESVNPDPKFQTNLGPLKGFVGHSRAYTLNHPPWIPIGAYANLPTPLLLPDRQGDSFRFALGYFFGSGLVGRLLLNLDFGLMTF